MFEAKRDQKEKDDTNDKNNNQRKTNLRAFIPLNLLSDVKMSAENINKKYKLGKKLRAQIFNVDPFKNRITLTTKKSLVDSKISALIDLNEIKTALDLKNGKIQNVDNFSSAKKKLLLRKLRANAVITEIKSNIIHIVYHNNNYGFIPKRFLSELGIVNPESFYQEGQTIDTTIQALTVSNQGNSIVVAAPSKVKDSKNEETC